MSQTKNRHINLECLPEDILYEIIYWLSHCVLNLHSSVYEIPKTFILNKARVGSSYRDLLSLSSTCKAFRKLLNPIIFESISLIRLNQVDTILCNPKSQERCSDKRKYDREFFKELIYPNISKCNTAEAIHKRKPIIGDKLIQSYYRTNLMITNYFTYLEGDNSILKGEDLDLFPNLKTLRILDEACFDMICTTLNFDLKSLSIHGETLKNTVGLLKVLSNLSRLDLFLDFGESINGFSKIIEYLQDNKLEEVYLFLNSPYAIRFEDTVSILECLKDRHLKSLSIRVKRRKSLATQNQSKWKLYQFHIGDKLNSIFQKVKDVILDTEIVEQLKFYSTKAATASSSVQLTLVDRAAIGPQMSMNVKENIAILIRSNQFSSLNFHYGENLDESHLHMLKLITDLVRLICNIPFDDKHYLGLTFISIEKTWSITDDSILREYILNMLSENLKSKMNSLYVWSTTPFNSPRYKVKDAYNISYTKSRGMSINDHLGYFIGTSDEEINQPIFTTVNQNEIPDSSFWTSESSLCDFEQYSLRQRRSLLWD